MPRRRQHLDLQPVDVDHLAVDQRLGAAAELRIGGAGRRTGELDDAGQRLGVVEVPVREQHQPDLAGSRDDGRDVRLVVRTRDRPRSTAAPGSLAQDPGVGALERHHPGVVAAQDGRPLGHLRSRS